MPIAVLPMLFLGVLSVALLFGGGYLVYGWWHGVLVSSALLWVGVALLVLSAFGRYIVLAFHRGGADEPSWDRDRETVRVVRPDGCTLHVELSGPAAGLPVVLVHGWGCDNRAFYYSKRAFARAHRVIAWDLRGLGKSGRPRNNDFSLEAMADDLAAVVDLAGAPAVLVGHSIGGMIVQTFARRHAARFKSDVIALVLVGTTYTNPVRTTAGAPVMRALQRPLFTPLMYLTIALSPLVWAMNWLSYFNGSQLLATALTGFGGRETRGQLDFATRFFVKAPPAVLARGMLAMFEFDETSSIGNIAVPVLVVSGDRDPVLLPEASDHIASVVRGALRAALPAAKHMGFMERHDEFDTMLQAFLEAKATVRASA
ncbi:MAG: alpha/beta fold hydrolase [Candidatus Baltobacteraceae bacterium]